MSDAHPLKGGRKLTGHLLCAGHSHCCFLTQWFSKPMRYDFPGDNHQGGEQGPSACWTLDSGLLLRPPVLPPPREEALTVVDSEKSQGQTQCPRFQMPAQVPTLSQRRDAPHGVSTSSSVRRHKDIPPLGPDVAAATSAVRPGSCKLTSSHRRQLPHP